MATSRLLQQLRCGLAFPFGPIHLALLIGVGSGTAFAALVVEHALEGEFDPIDTVVFAGLEPWRTERPAALFAAATHLGDTFVLLAVVAAGVGFLSLIRRRANAMMLAAVYAGGTLSVTVLKRVFALARPNETLHLVVVDGGSFPSGHASLSLLGYGLVAYLATARNPWRVRLIYLVGAVMLALVIGLSRLILGVHWLSDVLAGYALAGMWLAAASLLPRFCACVASSVATGRSIPPAPSNTVRTQKLRPRRQRRREHPTHTRCPLRRSS